MTSGSHAGCRFEFTGNELFIANSQIERRWIIRNGALYASSLLHVPTQTQWITKPSEIPSPCVLEEIGGEATVEATFSDQPLNAVQQHDTLVVNLTVTRPGHRTTYQFQLFTDSPGITIAATSDAAPTTQPTESMPKGYTPTGIESHVLMTQPAVPPQDMQEAFDLTFPHLKFLAVTLLDRSDYHDNLIFEREWILHPNEVLITSQGNLFGLENTLTGTGLVFLKHAPLPEVRPITCPHDAVVRGTNLSFRGHCIAPSGGTGYSYALLAYTGGAEGRTLALHRYQRQFRPYVPGRDGLLLTNTWGDRSQNKKISEAFIYKEIEAAEKIGADVVQIDDGWQKGRTANTTRGAKFESWWAQPDFWLPDPSRFPNGLAGISDSIQKHGMQFGLWFAPDSINDFANWRKDADKCLDLHRTLGAHFIKIDSVKMRTKQGETNYHKFLSAVINESDGKIILDLDVTAGLRPGYFGAIETGPLFIENRYTDWRRYWPHQTLRNFWLLSRYIDPLRLRMEFLNNARNQDKYPNDPLAPAVYDPAYLFATVMFSSPLGWFETSALAETYIASVTPLIKLWKSHRDAIYSAQTLPIGEAPDGTSWTGFLSRAQDGSLYTLILRELNNVTEKTFESRLLIKGDYKVQPLFGTGRVSVTTAGITANLPNPLSFVFARFTP